MTKISLQYWQNFNVYDIAQGHYDTKRKKKRELCFWREILRLDWWIFANVNHAHILINNIHIVRWMMKWYLHSFNELRITLSRLMFNKYRCYPSHSSNNRLSFSIIKSSIIESGNLLVHFSSFRMNGWIINLVLVRVYSHPISHSCNKSN